MAGPAAVVEAPVFDRQPVLMAEVTSYELVQRMAEEPVGTWAVQELVEVVPAPEVEASPKIESLRDAIQQAAAGNEQAKAMITANVASDVVERTIKAGHVMKVELDVDELGRLHQHGQLMQTVQDNTLRLVPEDSPMRPRTKAEAANTISIESALRDGELKDNYAVVITRPPAAEEMSVEAMSDAGFFTETMTFIIQATTEAGDIVELESAFVAGIPQDGEERQDEAMVIALGDALNVDLRGMSVADIIGSPILVPKSRMPRGTVDLVEIVDRQFNTFFGQAKPQQDYATFLDTCREREATMLPKVESIVDQLIAEAATIKTELQAVQRLHQLSEKEMVQQAVFDRSIDPRVFGPAARHIEESRQHFDNGNFEDGLASLDRAERTAKSDSCPTGVGKETNDRDADTLRDDTDSCTFVSKECPECGKKNVLTKVTFNKFTKTRRVSGSCKCVKYYKD